MCITSCKNISPFLKHSTKLNPSAREWSPHHIHSLHPTPPPQTAPPVHWQLPHLHSYHPVPFSHCFTPYVPLARPHVVVHHSTPVSFPMIRRVYEAAPPPLHDSCEKKHVFHTERKLSLAPTAEARKNLCRMSRPPPLRERKPRRNVDRCAAATTPPPVKQAAAAYKEIDEKLPSSSRTTVMIRNVPNQLRRDFLLEFLDSNCKAHSLEYDFVYLPMDFGEKNNLGYAFVNFTSSDDALKFKKILHQYEWGTVKTEKGFSYKSYKICFVAWARIQGKSRLMHRFENAEFFCDNLSFLPVVFDPPRDGSNATPPVVVGKIGEAN